MSDGDDKKKIEGGKEAAVPPAESAEPAKPASPFSAKNISLLALVFQQVALVLMIRHSRMKSSQDGGAVYVVSTAVVLAEVLKLVLNLVLELVFGANPQEDENVVSNIAAQIASPEALKLAIPALLYVIQNNLLFVALGNLTVPVYQVTNQGKLLTTAAFSRLLLNKTISNMQYFSLVILAAGVAIVQLSSIENKETGASTDQNQLLGLIAVFSSCATSGAAGVYFEKMLKSRQEISVYMRNCQLSVWSILLGLIPVCKDYETIQKNGFFAGYNAVVVGVILCQAGTGLIVALVMKYADTILKGFATSVAVVVATVLSMFIWNSRVDSWFVVGAAMVMWAVRLYSNHPASPTKGRKVAELNLKKLAKNMRFVLLSIGLYLVAPQISLHGEVVPAIDNMPTIASLVLPEAYSADRATQAVLPLGIGPKFDENDRQCQLRDVSQYTEYKRWEDKGSRQEKWAHCLRFECLSDEAKCDNTASTNFLGPEPPCCVHILRDMAREFDRAMCYLGLEYFPAFGMLLGLVRADRLIPWTIDNDYIMTEQQLSAMQDLWHQADHIGHGLGFHFDQVYRLCATPTFAGEQLAKWKVNETESWYADSVYPFADIFSMKQDVNGTFEDQRECYHEPTDLRPSVRKPVYNGTFYQNLPGNAEDILVTFFGEGWKTPDKRKKSHGGTHCGRRRAWQEHRARKRAERLAKKRP